MAWMAWMASTEYPRERKNGRKKGRKKTRSSSLPPALGLRPSGPPSLIPPTPPNTAYFADTTHTLPQHPRTVVIPALILTEEANMTSYFRIRER